VSGYVCPKCYSGFVHTERRPFGDSHCGQCQHHGPTATFLLRDPDDKASEERIQAALKHDRRVKANKAVDEAWEKNR